MWSRFITVQREGRALKAMAPVFDMFNHDPRSSTVHGFQESNQCLHLVTLQDWPSGSEVRTSDAFYNPLILESHRMYLQIIDCCLVTVASPLLEPTHGRRWGNHWGNCLSDKRALVS